AYKGEDIALELGIVGPDGHAVSIARVCEAGELTSAAASSTSPSKAKAAAAAPPASAGSACGGGGEQAIAGKDATAWGIAISRCPPAELSGREAGGDGQCRESQENMLGVFHA